MLRFSVIFLALFLSGCVDHIDGSKYDTITIEVEAQTFFRTTSDTGQIEAFYPDYIVSLSPKKIWIEPEGVYIQLQNFMSKESGIFVARPGVLNPQKTSYNPEFKILRGSVYSYVIED